MIVQTDKYKIVSTDSCLNIETYQLPVNTKLQYKIYSKEDIYHTTPLVTRELDSNNITTECLGSDGSYNIWVGLIPDSEDCYISNDDSIGYFYDFRFYKVYHDEFKNIISNFVCTCCEDNSLADCDNCNETNELKNKYSALTFIIYYLLYYSELSLKDFEEFFKNFTDDNNQMIKIRFDTMISYGNVRGVYELNDKNIYLFLAALYAYDMVDYAYKTDMIDETSFYTQKQNLHNCLIKHGLSYYKIENRIFETLYKGKLFSIALDCSGNTDCMNITNVFENYEAQFTKQDFIQGVTSTLENRIIIAIPKVWGLPDEILDNTNSNIKEDFILLNLYGYYIFVSDYTIIKDEYTIKLKYNEDR